MIFPEIEDADEEARHRGGSSLSENASSSDDDDLPLDLPLSDSSSEFSTIRALARAAANRAAESPTKLLTKRILKALKMMDENAFGFYQLVMRKHACRIRYILHQLNRGELPIDDLKKNLEYAALVLETAYMDDSRRICEEDEELPDVTPDTVPDEVREWLASTFTRQLPAKRTGKPKFKSVANAIRTGIFFDKMFKRISGGAQAPIPGPIAVVLKGASSWDFDIFALNEVSNGSALKYIGFELFNKYGWLQKFKIHHVVLDAFLTQLEQGYSKHTNPYHNLVHGADVAQTTHFMVSQTGLVACLTELETFAVIYAALIHDYEHTGHTNNFHVQSGSEYALLYNDRSVLENFHVSACFKLMRDPEKNLLAALSREEYREFRNLVIEMILATDMSTHFVQVKTMKSMLALPESVDKLKGLCLLIHCCDISHPAKPWALHNKWTMKVLEEFFRQGDLEASLGLPYSPLCDRNTTHVAESQIGFIDFIVEPSMMVCGEMIDPLVHIPPSSSSDESGRSSEQDNRQISRSASTCSDSATSISDISTSKHSSFYSRLPLTSEGKLNMPQPWFAHLQENKVLWKEHAAMEEEQRKKKVEAAKMSNGPSAED